MSRRVASKPQRIDVHHHYFPANFDKAKSNEKAGWRTPAENLPWSPEISLKFMDAASIDVAILSPPGHRLRLRVLAEIAYAFDELKADGIGLSSSYGEGKDATYVGDDRYDAIWAELDKRKATVFLHGAQTPSSTPHPHPFLGVPVVEVPNETFKAAAHLVVTGRKRKYPNTRIILAHLGGSTPFLAARVAVLSRQMGCSLR
ncbi:hypothetical protein MVEN_01238700 [Mycena venus]|uniref:6-methylsalicylate decarboxylase n=1 Tax=Mycena venus TaxID=2733690 RepID=A0A8H6Y287_9AGAR|nr:hypothetical protein MVEN_01238700 [Mycena venus]